MIQINLSLNEYQLHIHTCFIQINFSTYLSARVVIQKLPLHALIGKNVVMETNTSCWNVPECVTTMKHARVPIASLTGDNHR
jgi:hypothetical protein